MNHESEAECLLRTGNLYLRRAGVEVGAAPLIFIGVKHGAVSVYHGDEPFYHFDLEGRWQRAYISGKHYRKALDGTVSAIDRVREGSNLILRRRSLSFAEVADLDASIRGAMLELSSVVGPGGARIISPPGAPGTSMPVSEVIEFCDRVAAWDADAWFRHRERYLATYAPLETLPPDAHQSIVLQMTFRDRADDQGDTVVRTPAEFEDHARAVADLLGRRAAQARSLFLAGPEALRQDPGLVAECLEIAARVFPIAPGGPAVRRELLPADAIHLVSIDTMLSDLSPGLPGPDGWEALKARGLGRVTLDVGMSPDPGLEGSVRDLKAAGVDLGILIRVQPGQLLDADRLGTLPLGRRDLVYLVDASEEDPTGSEELARLRESLTPLRERGARVVPYNIEKQWN